jgi:hypothetical protein
MYNEENSKKLDFQIGGLVGSLIWTRMGHLWIDSHNPPVAGVSTYKGLKELEQEDTLKWTSLSDAWYISHQEDQRSSPYEEFWKFDRSEKSENLWKELKQLERELRDKYLPNPFIYREDELKLSNIKDMDLFLDGIITYLWNTDFCQYSLKKEDIQIVPGEYSTKYIFKFDQDEKEIN